MSRQDTVAAWLIYCLEYLQMEWLGYILPEAIMFLFVLLASLGLVALRRRFNGHPAFTHQDRQFLFGRLRAGAFTPKLCFKLAIAVALFSIFALLEMAIFASTGPAIVSGALIMTLIAVTNLTLM